LVRGYVNDKKEAMTFQHIWELSRHIAGSFEKEEAELVYDTAKSYGGKANLVEIGCYCGRSSSVLGLLARSNGADFVTMDNFITPPPPGVEDVFAKFTENMEKVGANYKIMKMPSQEAAKKYKKAIDFLFVDGSHSYHDLADDINLWVPKVRVGGKIAFHDYHSSWVGVKMAVDQLKGCEFRERARTLRVYEKIKDLPQGLDRTLEYQGEPDDWKTNL
jgi:predicted O-methyltransferase YrrM